MSLVMRKPTRGRPEKKGPVRKVQEYYDTILSSLVDGIVVVDQEARMTTFSATAEQMMGVKGSALQGQNLSAIFKEDSKIHTLVRKTIQTGRSYSDSNFSVHGYFGDRRDIGVVTSPLIGREGDAVGVVLVFRDLSQIKSLEERLRKGERLVSLGILSAGMAHEIKNPLGGIRGAAQLLRDELGPDSSLNEYTEVIVREADRLNKILQGLLNYSKPPELKLRPVNLHQVLDRVVSLVRMESPEGQVRFVRKFDPSLPEVTADPDQLIQVFLNLIQNAIDAMSGRGVLTLTSRMLPGYHRQSDGQGKRGMIALDVEDTGCGIPPDEIGKVFEPFFTKKTEGVGLGLSLCHRIIEEHGGKIDVVSHPGEWTRFSICLPITI